MADRLQPEARHAFIVDDEPQVRTLIARAVSAEGYEPHEFSRVLDVETALTQFSPDIIILDLSLEESDAVEMIRSLAASRFGGKVLLVSGHGSATLEEVRKIGERRGLAMLPPLGKPFRIAEFKARLADVAHPPPTPATETPFETGLKNNWLELWYQPKIDLRTMAICGAEALIRLRHPQHGIMLPGSFLPSPGDPLHQQLTDFNVRRTLADWSAFAADPSTGSAWSTSRLAINVPASILQSVDFVDTVRRHLPTHPAFPGLIVEITEHEAISDPEAAREVAVQLRLYNIHVSIDDFGAGHSLLARLDELPFVELKLDRSFVDGCATDSDKRAMCQSVVDLARRFQLTAVAEGVENADDLRTLIDMGFDVAQGFYFARPMRSEAFAALLTPGGFSVADHTA